MSLSLNIERLPVADIPADVKVFLFENLYGPWGVDADDDWLGAEFAGEFLILRADDGTLIGTARLMPSDKGQPTHPTPPECAGERRLRQVAIVPKRRGQGIGTYLMRTAEGLLIEQGASRAGLAARNLAYDFYLSCGYSFVGEEFISPLTHIPHTHMSKVLSAPERS